MRNGLNRTELIAVLLSLTVAGCQHPCQELESAVGLPGWKAKGGNLVCARELRTLRRISKPFGSIANWRSATLDEDSKIFFRLVESLTKADASVPITAFPRWPKDVPCSGGTKITEDEWAKGPLYAWLPSHPSTMPASFELDVVGPPDAPVITLRAWQNYNCDEKLGLLETVGRIDRARHKFDQLSYRSPQDITE